LGGKCRKSGMSWPLIGEITNPDRV
jgi:hypothetical protein